MAYEEPQATERGFWDGFTSHLSIGAALDLMLSNRSHFFLQPSREESEARRAARACSEDAWALISGGGPASAAS